MAYIGNIPAKGENNSFKLLDNIKTYTETFDGSSSSVINNSADSINVNNHRFVQGQRVVYSASGGTVITGLSDNAAYYIIKEDKNTFKLASSASNAAAGTVVAIAPAGSTTNHKLTVGFDAINTKFLASYDGGTKAEITRSAQLNISINGVVQEPQDTKTPTAGFGHDIGSIIVFSTAPDGNDSFWGNLVANNFPTFDQSDNKIDNFTGDNTTTDFTLSKTPPDNRNILVTLDGVTQHPSDASTTRAYTLAENVLSFTSAPASLVSIQVRHIGFAGASSGGGGGGVTSLYGRTGAVVLKSTDNPTVGNLSAGGWLSVGSTATFDNNVTIKGVLTYDDVTIVDALGFSTFREGLRIKDDKKLLIGDATNGDLQIHHTSNNSHIEQAGTGQLYFDGNTSGNSHFTFRPNKSEVAARMFSSGPVELYAANSKKIETSGDGVEISGVTTSTKRIDIDAGGLNVTAGISTFGGAIDANSTLDVLNTSNFQNDVTFVGAGSSDAIWFKDSARFKLKDNAQIVFGNGQDLEIWHDSTDSFVKTTTGDLWLQSTADDVIVRAADNISLQVQGGEYGVEIAGNAGVKLFYDASVHTTAKLETTGGGITVAGIVTATSFNGAGISSATTHTNVRPTLDFNFAAAKKLDPRISYQRAGTASYTDHLGIVKFASANTPRFDHDPTTLESKGLLFEETRTNEIINSSDMSGLTLYYGHLTSNVGTAPDGTATANLFTPNKRNSMHRVDHSFTSGQITNTTVYSFSIFAKANGYDKLHVRYGGYSADNHGLGYDLSDGTTFAGKFDGTGSLDAVTSSSIVEYPNGWYRCSFTFTTASNAATGAAGINYYISNSESTTNYAGDGTSGMYLWGAQFESGIFPTSYIRTNGYATQRGYDIATMTGKDLTDVFNPTEGTMFYEASVSDLQNDNQAIVAFRDVSTTTDNYHAMGHRIGGGSVGNIRTWFKSNNANTYLSNHGSTGMAAGVPYKHMYGYKLNDATDAYNTGAGAVQGTDTSVTPMIASGVVDELRFGGYYSLGTTYQLDAGHIKRFSYWRKKLSNAQIKTYVS